LEEHATPIFRVETYRVRKWLSNTEQVVTNVVANVHGGDRKLEPGLGQQEILGKKTTLFRVNIFFSERNLN
jgi:hypothetical protein